MAQNQHYLPQVYRNGFCREGRLWVFDQERMKIRQDTPKNVGVERDYYTYTDDDGNRRNEIEGFFSQRIENGLGDIIRKLDHHQPPDETDIDALISFIVFQKVRGPQFTDTTNTKLERLQKDAAKKFYPSVERTAELVAQFQRDTGTSIDPVVTPERLFDFVQNEKYTIDFDRSMSLRFIPANAQLLTQFCSAKNWQFHYAPERSSFITSDEPIVIIPERKDAADFSKTFASYGALIPLSQHTCLVLSGKVTEHRAIRGSPCHTAFVRRVNTVITQYRYNLLIARDRELLDSLLPPAITKQVKQNERSGNRQHDKRK